MVQELTRLKISNASLLDEGSAGGEALYMAYNIHDGQRNKIFIDENVFVTTKSVIQTKAYFLKIEVVVGKYTEFLKKHDPKEFFGIIVQTPDAQGILHDFSDFFAKIDETNTGVTKIIASDLLAMTLTKPPGEMGADVCFGSAQRFGVPMGFGGPYSGFFATKEKNIRRMPGRIIGQSIDADNKMSYRMTLQTREQHIRREKATSNICTAQALLANIAGMYGVYHGPNGLRNIARRINLAAQMASRIFEHYGFTLVASLKDHSPFFDTITVVQCNARKLAEAFERHEMNIHVVDDHTASLSFSEVTKEEDLIELSKILAAFTTETELNVATVTKDAMPFELGLERKDQFMAQKIFNEVHSETEMMRYLRSLQEKDISLDRSMISLGSCTMKLNAATEMMPLTWPEVNLHPFVPNRQAEGYLFMIDELRRYLKSVTQFDEVSFQPNSGASGEYAGLLTIAKYLECTGQGHRNICLIPRSAHGTNPASAVLAGMKVVVVETINGQVDLNDMKAKVEKYAKNLGAFMITFPSTTGKYESTIHEMVELVHKNGGQVYMDGANMNAQVGFTSPGYLGADVCHLNLHKTFAIPHGGGGPGMGPIGVKKHLIPYLPTHPYSET
jgi:glycine dehydrogenase